MTRSNSLVKKKKVAVLGGGIGSISAAYELIKNRPDDYDITIYQMGFRIGGKGASGRNPDPQYHQRIEEHGLHMWSGLYENSFRIMREAYEFLDRPKDSPLATIDDAFKKHSTIVLYEKFREEWKTWEIVAPTNDETPGVNHTLYLSLYDYVSEALQMIIGRREASKSIFGKILTILISVLLFPFIALASIFAKCLEFFHASWLVRVPLIWGLKTFMKVYWWETKKHLDNDTVRRNFLMANTAFGNLHGALEENVFKKGMEGLDAQDYKAWLSKYIIWDADGDGESLTLNGPLVQFIYDAQFSYLQGDLRQPNIGAGSALRTVIRMAFTWRGAILWKMQAGMGDTVFTPFYKVLREKGVKFEFFQKVDELQLSSESNSIESIRMTCQAKVKDGPYEPLVEVKGLPCWPSSPHWDQLLDGEKLKAEGVNFESYSDNVGTSYELKKEEDFDIIVFGIPVDCIPIVGKNLVDSSISWQLLVEKLKTVRTQALQTWWKTTSEELGVKGADHSEPLLSCYHATSLNTMSDMTYLDKRETWSEGAEEPKSQIYFCGPMADSPDQKDQYNQQLADQVAQENSKVLLDDLSKPLLPKSWSGASFDWNNLFAEDQEVHGEQLLKKQYIRANVSPQERFTLTNTGSTRYRIRPGNSGFDNLFLAGDWTDNSFNLSNIEATVMSGMLCSKAICGFPKAENIVGLGFGCNPFARY